MEIRKPPQRARARADILQPLFPSSLLRESARCRAQEIRAFARSKIRFASNRAKADQRSNLRSVRSRFHWLVATSARELHSRIHRDELLLESAGAYREKGDFLSKRT